MRGVADVGRRSCGNLALFTAAAAAAAATAAVNRSSWGRSRGGGATATAAAAAVTRSSWGRYRGGGAKAPAGAAAVAAPQFFEAAGNGAGAGYRRASSQNTAAVLYGITLLSINDIHHWYTALGLCRHPHAVTEKRFRLHPPPTLTHGFTRPLYICRPPPPHDPRLLPPAPGRPLTGCAPLFCIHAHNRDYLTGFHKRKQARRRFGLAMQEIKDRKERLEERKEVR